MNSTDQQKKRLYRSELRKEQAEATHGRILDALHERVRLGDREISYAVLAKQARVSVPTLYRHFPTKADLIHAFVERVESQPEHQIPHDPNNMREALRAFYRRFESPDAAIRHERLSVMWELSRVGTVPRRRAYMEAALDRRAPGLREPARTQMIDLAVVLVSSATGEAFRGYLELDADAIADRILLGLDAIFTHAQHLSRTEAP